MDLLSKRLIKIMIIMSYTNPGLQLVDDYQYLKLPANRELLHLKFQAKY